MKDETKQQARGSLARQYVEDIRHRMREIDVLTTQLVRLRRKCKHEYAFTGYDSRYAYAECPECLDRITWEHGIPQSEITADSPRPNLPRYGDPVIPPPGKFHSTLGPEKFMA